MDKILAPIKRRILKYVDNKGITKEKFYESTSISASNFKGNGLYSEIGGEKIAKILSLYQDIDPEWLLTGKGNMLKEEDAVNPLKKTLTHNGGKTNTQGIPLIPLEAMAGFGTGAFQIMNYETSRYIVPEFNELAVDFMIRIKGSSMQPKYNSGDLIACKKLPIGTFFQWNKVYVLDTIQGAMIKRIHQSQRADHLNCVSDNPNYPPFDLPLSEIHALALVVGVIRLE